MATILNEAKQSRGVPPRGRSAAMQGFDLAIDDKTATDIYNRIDTTEGLERDVLATQLENWASRKIAENENTAAQEHERIYTDLDGWWADRGGDEVPEDVKFGAANRKFIADQFNQTASEQGDLYPSYRDQYFLKTYGKAPASESEAYKTISESIAASQKVNQSYDLITGDIALALFDQVNKGTPVDVPALFTKWKEENAEILAALPDDWEANALKAAGEYYAENEKMLREHGGTLQRLYGHIVAATGRKVEGAPENDVKTVKDLNAVIDELGQLPKEVRDRGYTAILMAARRQGMEDKGFWEMAAEAWPRTLNTVRTTGLVAQETDAEAKVNLLRGNDPIFINKATGQVTPPSGTAFSPQDFEPVTDEQRGELLQQAETELQRFNVIRELRDLADNRFDPVKSNAKNGVLKFVQDIAIMGPQSLAYTAMAAVPVAGPFITGAAIYADEYNQLRLEGMSSSQARTLAAVSAPLQTAAEVFGAKLLFGRYKWYRETIQKLINPARFARSSQAAVSFFGKVVGENITEGVQDLTTPLVKDVAAALSEEYPDVNWEQTFEQWKDSRLEVLAATLMPVIGGSLVETFNNNERFASAKRRVQLLYKPMGITDEEVRYIEDGTTPEERNKRYTETLAGMSAERVQAVKDNIASQSRVATGTQEDATLPTLETQKDANGRLTYIVRDETGKEVYRSTKQAAAEEAFILTSARSTAARFNEEKVQLRTLVEWWNTADPKRADNEERVVRDTMQGTAQQKLEALQQANNKQGIEELHRRIAQSPYAGTPYDQIQILGEASVEQVGEMVFRSVIALNKNSRVRDAREEMHHTAVRMAVANGRVNEQTMREWLDATERVFAEKGLGITLPRADMTDIVESMAVVQEAFENERISADVEMSLPQAFVDYIKRMIQVLAEVLKRGKAIREALDAGMLPAEFEAFLVETTGVADQTAVDRARERTEQEVGATQNYSIGVSSQQDTDYLAAVERGDMETAQRMVDEAANRAGYDIGPVWHGGADGFTVFDWNRIGEHGTTEGKGFYFSNDRDLASGYADRHGGRLLRVYLRSGKPIDGKKQTITKSKWRQILRLIHVESEKYDEGTSPLWNYADVGYEGLEKAINEAVANITETSESDVDAISGFINGGADPQITYDAIYKLTGMTGIVESEAWGRDGHTIQIATSANHVKLADPVTYDASGNVIPLSQRFDATTGNINYSIGNISAPDVSWFKSPSESVVLGRLAPSVLRAIGKSDKPIILSSSIAAKNAERHPYITPQDSIRILKNALTSPDILIQDKPVTKPNYWLFVSFEESAKADKVLVELSETKEAFEVVNWIAIRPQSLAQKVNRAGREGGQVLITNQPKLDRASGLYALPSDSKLKMALDQYGVNISNYSISTQREIDRVQAAMGALDRSPLDTLQITEKIRQRFASIMAENMVELAAMRQGGVAEREVLDEEGNPIGPQPTGATTKATGAEIRRTKLLQALGELDGLLSALPPQVAAKVGGYTVLANIGTGDRALSNFFIKRLEMIDKELERYLKDRYTKALDQLFQRAKPRQDAAGKVPQGKLGASVHALFDQLKLATKKTVVEVDGEVTSLEQQVASGELEAEEEAMKGLLADVLPLFANWSTADASRMAQAVQIGFDILRKAYKRQRELTQIKRNQQEERRLVAKESTGITGDIDEAINKQQNIAGKRWQQWKALNVNLFGFDQLISFVFGRDSKITKEIVNAQRKADNVKADELIGVWEEWQGVLAELAGVEDSRSMKATHKGQDIVYRLAEPKTAKIKHTNMQGEEIELEFSQNQLITITMMWMQPKGRAHMMGKLDSDGNPIGDWHYDQDFVNRVEAKMTPEARAIRRFLLRKYAEEWSSINEVFVRLRGINMPQEDFYSPLGVDPVVAIDSGLLADPSTGFALSAPNRTPPALRSRGAAVAKPKFQDAVQVYFAHRKQMAHWKAYAEFNSDMLSVLGHRNTRNAVEAKGGVEALKTLNKWLTYMTQGGNIDAAAGLAMNEYFNGVMGRIASFILFGKVVTIAIQSTQLGAAAAKMPFPSYIKRLAKLLTGQMSWGTSLRSPYIQRRIKEMPPQVQLAMEGLLANKPSYIAEAARRVGWYISGSDGLYTAGTYAMIYDYRLEQAKKAGLSGPEAERVAREEAERDTDEVAQPTRMGARSAFEATMTSPLARSAWAFGSDARKNWAINSFLWFSNASADRKRQALYFTAAISTAMATVIRTIARDIKDDDDDELFDEKNWDVRRMVLMMATDFVYGFPVLGEMAEETVFRLFGEYRPQGSVLSVGDAPAALSRMPQHIADTLNGEADTDKIVKDVNRMLQGMGLFAPQAASAAALSNAAKDLYEFTKPLWKDDE